MILEKICNGAVKIVKVSGLDIHQNIYFGRQTVQPITGAQAAFWDFINRQDFNALMPGCRGEPVAEGV
jgi:hypothetical protein